MNKNTLYFFIGTEAELMKVFPVIMEARKRDIECKIISNGQNDIRKSPFLQITNEGKVDIDVSEYMPSQKSAKNHLKWFIKTERYGKKVIKEYFRNKDRSSNLIVVHGDTLSTVMGARIAKACKIKYVHIESGYRSHNIFSPFPEEIDRWYSSLKSEINFTVGDIPTAYAKRAFKGQAIDTVYNTGLETLFYALSENNNKRADGVNEKEKYFLFMIHRQENLMNKKFMINLVNEVINLSKKIKCIFIYHEQTKSAMEKFGVYEKIVNTDNIEIIPRQSYLNFIRLVDKSEFIVTDGCGNQQEFYYMGKPYLIMRTQVEEASEGLGINAKVFDNDFSNIVKFYDEYKGYTKERIKPKVMPSKIIIDTLEEYFNRDR